MPDARELLTANLPVIKRAVISASRRHRLSVADAEELSSIVNLKLVENDFAVLRKFQGRSSFATFIGVVVERVLLDHQIHEWGKWHASAEASRLGPAAVELERLLFRDGRTIDEAMPILSARFPEFTHDGFVSMAARLPRRPPRRRRVDIEEAESIPASDGRRMEDDLLLAERRAASERVSTIVSDVLRGLSAQDSTILRLRFDCGMSVADIARSLRLEQKLLYRRVDRLLDELRLALQREGIRAKDVIDLIGRQGIDFHFQVQTEDARPSETTNGETSQENSK